MICLHLTPLPRRLDILGWNGICPMINLVSGNCSHQCHETISVELVGDVFSVCCVVELRGNAGTNSWCIWQHDSIADVSVSSVMFFFQDTLHFFTVNSSCLLLIAGEWYQPVSVKFCSGREPLVINGTGFYRPDALLPLN